MKQYFDIRKFSRKQRIHFTINFLLGLGICLSLFWFENTTWGQKNINIQFDFYILEETRAAAQNPYDPRISSDIVFIDIDDPVFRLWGRPSITPRDKIAELIKLAYEGGAKIIIPNISFDEPDYSPAKVLVHGEPIMDGRTRDQLLRKELEELRNNGGTTKLILPVLTYSNGELRANIYNDLVDDKTIFRATPVVLESRYDRTVRYWKPYIIYSEGDKQNLLWSTPMLANAIARGDKADLDKVAAEILSKQEIKHSNEQFKLKFQGTNDSIAFFANEENYHQYNRIRFFLVPERLLSPEHPGNLYTNLRKVSKGPSNLVSSHDQMSLKDKIVIIGNSSLDLGDTYMTPVGSMQGMYVIGNIINTMLKGKQTFMIPLWLQFVFELLIIILAAYMFLHCHSFFSQIALCFLLIVILPVAYYVFLKTGWFLNVSFPLLGIGIHELIAKIEHLFNGEWRNSER